MGFYLLTTKTTYKSGIGLAFLQSTVMLNYGGYMNCSKGLNTKVILNLVAAIALTLTASFATASNCDTATLERRGSTIEKAKPSPQKPNNDYNIPSSQDLVNQPVPQENDKFPIGPDPVMTPGKLCEHGTKRYAQQITYCDRDVSGGEKNAIIADYDNKLGFKIRTMNRGDFKIDHFIPLSIGGANDTTNLWPQHKSIYAYSDKIELYVFQLLQADKILQKEAIDLVKECKLNLSRCPEIEGYLEGKLGN